MSLSGRELDAAVAERIMNLPSEAEIPAYSARAYDAFFVALQMANNGWHFDLEVTEPDQRYVVGYYRPPRATEKWEADEETFAKAVCVASLKAAGFFDKHS
jgi:Phage ABA sandwich domain